VRIPYPPTPTDIPSSDILELDLSISGSDIPLNQMESFLPFENPEPTVFYSKAKRIAVISSVSDVARNVPMNELYGLVMGEKVPRWVDVQGLEAEEIAQIGNMFNIHPLTIEDCVVSDTREKLEHIQNYYFVVINELSYKENTNIVQNHNLSVVVLPNLIITFHQHPVYCVYDVVHKMETRHGGQLPSTEWALHAILDSITDAYETHVNQLIAEAHILDEMLVNFSCVQQSELLGRINSACKRSSYLLQGLVNKEDVLNTLLIYRDEFSPNALVYLKNVYDQLLRIKQKLESTSKLLTELNSVYMSKVTVELAVAANVSGHVVKLFAINNVIFMPLGLIAGIGGMNALIPGENDPTDQLPTNYHYFISILGIMCSIALFLFYTFYRLHWTRSML